MSSIEDAADKVFNANAESRTLAPAAVGSQVALMSVISVRSTRRYAPLRFCTFPLSFAIPMPPYPLHVEPDPPDGDDQASSASHSDSESGSTAASIAGSNGGLVVSATQLQDVLSPSAYHQLSRLQ